MIDIRDLVRNFINNNFIVGKEIEYLDGDSLLDKGIVNSTGVLELMLFLEEEFKIVIKDEEVTIENLDSVSKIIKFVEAKLDR